MKTSSQSKYVNATGRAIN